VTYNIYKICDFIQIEIGMRKKEKKNNN
jgi:hypothetical protein